MCLIIATAKLTVGWSAELLSVLLLAGSKLVLGITLLSFWKNHLRLISQQLFCVGARFATMCVLQRAYTREKKSNNEQVNVIMPVPLKMNRINTVVLLITLAEFSRTPEKYIKHN